MNTKIMGIYKITNKINGKIYIGSSIDIKRRWKEHKRQLDLNIHKNKYMQNSWLKYGEENFKFEVIENVYFKDKLIEREQFYVDFYKSYNRGNGYNVAVIVDAPMNHRKHSDKSKKIMREKKLGTKWSKSQKENKSKQVKGKPLIKNRKKVYQYKLNGEFIKLWDSISIAAKEMNIDVTAISNNCLGKTHSSYGFIWSYNKEIKINNEINYGRNREIVQLNKDGSFVKLWSSAKEAAISLNLDSSAITKTCKGKINTSGGFIWIYYKEYQIELKEIIK